MLGRVVCGSRTWIWMMAAPALAASIEERAICSGLTGTAGFLPGESAEPVTAHEIMPLRSMLAGSLSGAPICVGSSACGPPQLYRDIVDQSRAAEPRGDQEADR